MDAIRQVYLDTRVMEYNDVWDVGMANWAAGEVVNFGDISKATVRGCP